MHGRRQELIRQRKFRIRQLLLLRLSVCTAIALGVIGCSKGTSRDVEATVLSATGNCILRRGQVEMPLNVDVHPRPGDLLETGADGQIDAALLPNVLVELAPSTVLEIAVLSLAKDGNDTIEPMRARIAHVRLIRGSLALSQRRVDVAAEPSLRIETAHGTATSEYDCLFQIATDSSGTRVACEEGYVYLASATGGERVQVEPAFTGEVASDRRDVALRSGDTVASPAFAELGSIESRLTQLLTAEQQAPPPWIR